MAKLLITGTHGPEDPSRASFPFHVGKGAREAGHEVSIVLANDASVLMRETVRNSLQGVGMPALRDLFEFAISHNVRVYI